MNKFIDFLSAVVMVVTIAFAVATIVFALVSILQECTI